MQLRMSNISLSPDSSSSGPHGKSGLQPPLAPHRQGPAGVFTGTLLASPRTLDLLPSQHRRSAQYEDPYRQDPIFDEKFLQKYGNDFKRAFAAASRDLGQCHEEKNVLSAAIQAYKLSTPPPPVSSKTDLKMVSTGCSLWLSIPGYLMWVGLVVGAIGGGIFACLRRKR